MGSRFERQFTASSSRAANPVPFPRLLSVTPERAWAYCSEREPTRYQLDSARSRDGPMSEMSTWVRLANQRGMPIAVNRAPMLRKPEATPRTEPRVDTEARPQPKFPRPQDLEPPPPASAQSYENGDVHSILAALEVSTVADALTRITQIHQQHQSDSLEIERLKKRIAKVEGERDQLAFGSKLGELLYELKATTVKEALANAKELNVHVLGK
jgi:hypothetical protein